MENNLTPERIAYLKSFKVDPDVQAMRDAKARELIASEGEGDFLDVANITSLGNDKPIPVTRADLRLKGSSDINSPTLNANDFKRGGLSDVQANNGERVIGLLSELGETDKPSTVKQSQPQGERVIGLYSELYPQEKPKPAPKPAPKAGIGERVVDNLIALEQGGIGAVKSVSDAFGANNQFSKSLQQSSDAFNEYKSQTQLANEKEAQAIDAASKDEGVVGSMISMWNQVKANPAQITQVLGGMIPNILIGTEGLIAKTAAGMLGLAQGVGETKGKEYDTVYQMAKEAGYSENDRVALAQKAQEYGEKNLTQQLAGAVLGAVDNLGGLDRLAGKVLRGQPSGVTGRLKNTGIQGASEAGISGAQGFQGQVAGNEAAINAGLMDESQLYDGAVTRGIKDATLGAIIASPLGAIQTSSQTTQPQTRGQRIIAELKRRQSQPSQPSQDTELLNNINAKFGNESINASDVLGEETNVSEPNTQPTTQLDSATTGTQLNNAQGGAGNTLSEPTGTGMGDVARTLEPSGRGDIQRGVDVSGGGSEALDDGKTRSLSSDSSWVIRNKDTGEVIQETFQKSVAEKVNTDKYEAVPIAQHLGEMNDPNSKVRKFAEGNPTAEQSSVAASEPLGSTEQLPYLQTIEQFKQSNPEYKGKEAESVHRLAMVSAVMNGDMTLDDAKKTYSDIETVPVLQSFLNKKLENAPTLSSTDTAQTPVNTDFPKAWGEQLSQNAESGNSNKAQSPKTYKKPTSNPLFEKNKGDFDVVLRKLNWAQVGNKRIHDAKGNQIGRTQFVPMDEDLEKIRATGTLSYAGMQAAVRKAQKGEPLSKAEHKTIDDLAQYIENNRELFSQPVYDEKLAEEAQARDALLDNGGNTFDELFYGKDTYDDKIAVTELDDDLIDTGIAKEVSLDEFEKWLNTSGVNNEQSTDNERVGAQTESNEPTGTRGTYQQDTPRDNPESEPQAPNVENREEVNSNQSQDELKSLVAKLYSLKTQAKELRKSGEKHFDKPFEQASELANGKNIPPAAFKLQAVKYAPKSSLNKEAEKEFQDLSKLKRLSQAKKDRLKELSDQRTVTGGNQELSDTFTRLAEIAKANYVEPAEAIAKKNREKLEALKKQSATVRIKQAIESATTIEDIEAIREDLNKTFTGNTPPQAYYDLDDLLSDKLDEIQPPDDVEDDTQAEPVAEEATTISKTETVRPDLTLSTQTNEEILAREQAQKASDAEKTKADAKAKADEDKRALEAQQRKNANERPFEFGEDNKKVQQAIKSGSEDMFAQEDKPAQTTETVKPETEPTKDTSDVGGEMGYNRRMNGITRDDIVNANNDTERVQLAVKSKIWEKPNYQALVDSGVRPEIAHIVKQMYDTLSTKPAFEGDKYLYAYVETVEATRDAVSQLLADKKLMDGMIVSIGIKASQRSFTMSSNKTREIADFAKLGEQFKGSDPLDFVLDKVFPVNAKGKRWGRQNEEGNTKANATGNRFYLAMQVDLNSFIDAMKAVEDGFPSKKEQWQISYRIEEKDGKFNLIKKGKYSPVSVHDTQEQAIESARELTKRTKQEAFEEPETLVEDVMRDGEVIRKGNVSSQELKDTIGLRAVNFGNWMSKPTNAIERQKHVNSAFDAFHDLASILNLPIKAMALNGELALAIGAQGTGRYAAHFVAGFNEINLTRTKGAGSLAHEWAHALDHYFGVKAGLATKDEPWASWLTKYPQNTTDNQEIRPEIAKAFKTIYETMKSKVEDVDSAKERHQKPFENAQKRLTDYVEKKQSIKGQLNTVKEAVKGDEVAEKALDSILKGEAGKQIKYGTNTFRIGRTKFNKTLYENVAKVANKLGWSYAEAQDLNSAAGGFEYTKELVSKEPEQRSIHTDFYRNANLLDAGKSKTYWSKPHELFARAFEMYVADKLAEKSQENRYLVAAWKLAESADIEDATLREIIKDQADKRYPRGGERTEINKAFDTLISEIKTKETDNGNVAMFSRSAKRTPFIAQNEDGYLPALNKTIAMFKSGDRAKQQEAGKTPIPISRTPVVLRQVIEDDGSKPFKRAEFVVGQGSTLYLKADNVHGRSIHSGRISKDVLDRLPQLLADPIAVFKSSPASDDSKSFKVLLDAKDENENPVIVAIKPNVPMQQLNNSFVNFQATIFPTTWDKVQEWNKDGLLRYYNEKSPRISVAASNPREAATEVDTQEGFDATIGVSASKVKVVSRGYIEAMPDSAFSRGQSNPYAIDQKEAQEIVDEIQAKHPNIPKIKLVFNRDDMPIPQDVLDGINAQLQDRQDALDKANATGDLKGVQDAYKIRVNDVEGMYRNGEVWINASAINTIDRLKEVFAHETIGHYAIEKMLNEVDPKLFPKLIKQVQNLNKLRNPYIRNVWNEVKESQPTLDDNATAKEVLAFIVERGDQNQEFTPMVRSLWQKIIDGIKAFAKLVFDVDLNDRDVRDIMAMAERYAKGEVNKSELVSVIADGKVYFSLDGKDNTIPETIKVNGINITTQDLFSELTDNDDMFKYGKSDAKDLQQVFDEVVPQLVKVEKSNIEDDEIDAFYHIYPIDNKGNVKRNQRGQVMVYSDGKVEINVASWDEGFGGSRVYAAVGNWAFNNGYVFAGDRDGITSTGKLRRLENMISLALKFGTTDHIEPHPDQMRDLGFDWKEGDTAYNLGQMLEASYKAIRNGIYVNESRYGMEVSYKSPNALGVAKLDDLVYDFETQEFKDLSNGNNPTRFTDKDFESLARTQAARATNAGSTTLKRAAIAHTFIRTQGDGRKRLLELISKLKFQRLDNTQLKEIFYSRSNQSRLQPEWETLNDSTLLDDLVYKFQDKHKDLKDVTKAIKNTGAQIADRFNTYLQEELYHGRVAKRTQDFIATELEPLLKALGESKIPMADFEHYLWARHAEERNAQIAKVNPDMLDGGSGLTNAEAKAYLNGIDAETKTKLDALAGMVDEINKRSRQILVEYGIEDMDTASKMESAYQYYVPLMRDEMEKGFGSGTGQGFSIKGNSTKRAMGSNKSVVDILANIAQQREKFIVRGEKNRVATALVGLAKTNPNDEFWKVDTPPTIRFINKTTGLVDEMTDPNYKSRDNVVVARILDRNGRGQERAVVFNEFDKRASRMAESLKNLDVDGMEEWVSRIGAITRYFASVNTQYNPLFGVVNITRDIQSALLNLASTELANNKADVLSNTPSALKGIYSVLRGKRSGKAVHNRWADLWDEFQREGGQTGYRELFRTAKDRTDDLQKVVDPAWWRNTKWGKAVSLNSESLANAEQFAASKVGKPLFQWLEDYNTTLENSVRLSAYKVALDKGMTKQQAASLAKNLTVNFNRKGASGARMGAFYAFFNASVQGTARIGETMFKDGKLSMIGKRIISGGMMLGVIQALALAGFDDDDPPQFERDRNLIIPIGDKKYIKIPMPLGFHVIPSASRILTEYAMKGGKATPEMIAHLGALFAESFNPVGGSGTLMQILSPTVTDPLVALSENQDFAGRPIYQKDFNSLDPTPGFKLAKDTATKVSTFLAEIINKATGGTDFQPGIVSPTPDQIDYLIGQAFGGVGREAMKTENVASSIVEGTDLPTYKIPLVGKFYGNSKQQSSEGAAFYRNIETMNRHENEIKGRTAEGLEVKDYLSENPEASLWRQSKFSYRVVSKLRDKRQRLLDSGAPADDIKKVDEEITNQMRRFNELVSARKK